MKTASDLSRHLQSLDRKSYPACKSLAGQYQFDQYILSIDHVQGDPFAAPSRLHILMDQRVSGFPISLFDRPWKKTALEDQINRLFYRASGRLSGKAGGSGKSGLIAVSRCGQEILARTSVDLNEKSLIVRFEVGFPAAGRSILARELEKILFSFLPEIAASSMIFANLDQGQIHSAVDLADDQHALREQLASQGLVAFVADGSVLPRESGVSERPMKDAVAFRSPKSLSVTMTLPHRGQLTGMGISKGITLIAGGGYHGKSTLLAALQRGIYDHIRGDGREYVVCDDTAVKIRAEDGRGVVQTDISAFIRNLPGGKDTRRFTTENASGSTSQAANVAEAVEAGSRLLLIDEDTSATNFMIRDDIMQKLISPDKEPITPFTNLIRPLYDQGDVSSILVIGSSGAYIPLADVVIQMDSYEPKDITPQAKSVCAELASAAQVPADLLQIDPASALPTAAAASPADYLAGLLAGGNRRILAKGSIPRDDRGVKIKTVGRDNLVLNRETIDLRYVEQLADTEQLMTLGQILTLAEERFSGRNMTLPQIADTIMTDITTNGLTSLAGAHRFSGSLAAVRKQDILACLNRLRRLHLGSS